MRFLRLLPIWISTGVLFSGIMGCAMFIIATLSSGAIVFTSAHVVTALVIGFGLAAFVVFT